MIHDAAIADNGAIEGNDADIATNVTNIAANTATIEEYNMTNVLNIAANTTAIEGMMLTSQRMLRT